MNRGRPPSTSVSTSEVENQVAERERVAEFRGWRMCTRQKISAGQKLRQQTRACRRPRCDVRSWHWLCKNAWHNQDPNQSLQWAMHNHERWPHGRSNSSPISCFKRSRMHLQNPSPSSFQQSSQRYEPPLVERYSFCIREMLRCSCWAAACLTRSARS